MVRTMTFQNPFGDLDDKSLESPDIETKADDDADDAPDADTFSGPSDSASFPEGVVTVEMIHHGDHDGANLIPGEVYDLPAAFAAKLIGAKRAKPAE